MVGTKIYKAVSDTGLDGPAEMSFHTAQGLEREALNSALTSHKASKKANEAV